ncbi:hypothetical protein BC349_10775 [Flavihumibacter stibioxidans]|uniref:Secretion system C-terminal sorting domain-containing protein n=1 Tax=Flavihumibacter stibioxidans TaxID=1834163 RepID=A0ABR7M918_9BACT|nr:hypothetical protein [Flavihumibacter stibioxidans]
MSVDVTGFSGFIVHGSLAPLPLRLLSFQAARLQQNVVLNWRTTAETGVSHFEIERSVDGHKFLPVGQVPALNVTGDQNYRYSDLNAINLAAGNTIYYRLRMVDIDHRYTYSPVRRVALEGTAAISVYPNPVGSTLTVQMPLHRTGSTGIRLVDLQGRIIKNWNFPGTSGLLHLDVQEVPSGLYQLEISQGAGERKSYKVIKL